MKNYFFVGLFSLIASLNLTSCASDNDNNSSVPFEVRMTDSPGDYESVKIDLLDVKIKVSDDNDDSKGWQSLKTVKPGIYDLLELTNGKDILIANDAFPAGKISQIRLILGDNNSVTYKGVVYPMRTPSSQTSGLKLKMNANLQAGITYKLLLDFDASKSIVQNSNKFSLKPVIRFIAEAQSGAIKGKITPLDSQPAVWAISGADSIGTYANANGDFLIKGIPVGSYRVSFSPKNNYLPRSIDGVRVDIGVVTDMKTVTITK